MNERPKVWAHEKFQQVREEFAGLELSGVFEKIHATNLWGASQSISGLGSELEATAGLRELLPALLRDLAVGTMLDIPCGDFHWLSQVELPVDKYIGADIVEEVVLTNSRRYGGDFRRLDLCSDPLPAVDLILCRDCLVHISNANARRALDNMRASGSRWLLTTHFLECSANVEIENGDWRMLNLELTPFGWPPPQRVLLEGCGEADGGYADKSLSLWPLR